MSTVTTSLFQDYLIETNNNRILHVFNLHSNEEIMQRDELLDISLKVGIPIANFFSDELKAGKGTINHKALINYDQPPAL